MGRSPTRRERRFRRPVPFRRRGRLCRLVLFRLVLFLRALFLRALFLRAGFRRVGELGEMSRLG
ncbi:MAG TPA: hypothetical protein VFI65_13305 [Streptosporangiaceae bacterium]|nr:hypothetical protein [Streptosporangiaceae bacterium]